MKWEEKLAVLKVAGYKIYQSNGWEHYPNEHYRYVCERDERDPNYGVGETKAKAVNEAWELYTQEIEDEKAS